jgi:hypothetical protein
MPATSLRSIAVSLACHGRLLGVAGRGVVAKPARASRHWVACGARYRRQRVCSRFRRQTPQPAAPRAVGRSIVDGAARTPGVAAAPRAQGAHFPPAGTPSSPSPRRFLATNPSADRRGTGRRGTGRRGHRQGSRLSRAPSPGPAARPLAPSLSPPATARGGPAPRWKRVRARMARREPAASLGPRCRQRRPPPATGARGCWRAI